MAGWAGLLSTDLCAGQGLLSGGGGLAAGRGGEGSSNCQKCSCDLGTVLLDSLKSHDRVQKNARPVVNEAGNKSAAADPTMKKPVTRG